MTTASEMSLQAQLGEAQEALRQQCDQLERLLAEKYEPIAIVGVGLRFPGGNDTLTGFTEFLRDGRSAIGPVPADRWDADACAGTGRGTVRTGGGGFLDAIDQFDAKFFNISPKEANCMDPQQRLVLETAWEALENAGIDPTGLRHGDGGVYLGAGSMDYVFETNALRDDELDGQIAAGVAHSAISGRLSYFLGWRGPSITVDTACSASLVALHLAVEGLRRRECGIALCGGVNAIHHPRSTALFCDLNALAPDGRCKTFDENADGYGRAEGCGVLVLKTLSGARRDGDRILALVRGTAVGQDGESAGLTAPNGAAQRSVMLRAIAAAGLEPRDIQYVEAHGTGTPLGDPIEMGAIGEVFAESHSKDDPVVVGSLKTNIGHMEPAAGVGGIVKLIAQLQTATIFPLLNMDTPSPRIPWAVLPVTVPTRPLAWQADTRRAVVNSFGFAGTIASAVLEEAPPAGPQRERATEGGAHVFTLSAKTALSLRRQIERFQRFLTERPDLDVADVCYTANVGRAHFPYRIAGVARDRRELAALLEHGPSTVADGATSDIRKVAFLFTGQGAQHVGMGATLYRSQPVFRRWVDECDRLFTPWLGRSIKALMFGEVDDADAIHQTRYTQPALFVLEYALAKLWLSWGVRPNALVGHSIGELVAATTAGLFTLPDGVKLVAARARLMDAVSTPGGMVSVRAAAEDIAPLLKGYGDVGLAAINAPRQCVVSGGRGSLAELVETFRQQGLQSKPLAVSHAFHSPLMAEVFDEFRTVVGEVGFHEPEFTIISNLTGRVARWREISKPDYWVRHIGEPVNFEAGIREVERRGRHAFIEIGPSATLIPLARKCVSAGNHAWLPSLQPTGRDDETIVSAVAALYAAGPSVSWPDFHAASACRRVELPSYAFDRRRFWLPTARPGGSPAGPEPAGPRGTGTGTSAASEGGATVGPAPGAGVTPADGTRGLVRSELARILEFEAVDDVDVDATFVELGLNSLDAAALRDSLQAAIGVPIPLSAVFDHPSVRRFALFLDQQRSAASGAEPNEEV